MKTEPNKAVEPTPVSVTIPAAQEVAPLTSVAHLSRSAKKMKSADLTNDVSFHDSTLERVEQKDGRIVLHLDTVAAHLSYLEQKSTDEYIVLDQVRLDCEDARTRKLEFWSDTTGSIKHPDPDHPMIEIMENDLEDDVLQISGFGPSSGWVVWQIEAKRFVLQWEGQTRYKRPQAEQD